MRVISGEKGETDSAKNEIKRRHRSHSQGKLTVVGIGPGSLDLLTLRAKKAIEESSVIAGYKTYIALLGNLSKGKELISTGMTHEVERARQAIDKAKEGCRVCLVSSGDPGVYGMAGLVLELLKEDERVEVEIIPGVMASSASAAILGAPLTHDFAVISLSDLLTDLSLIEQRVEAAAKADFVIALYNPKGKKRAKPLQRAWQILMRCKSPKTPVGIVRNCERAGQKVKITTLEAMLSFENIDMVTTIIVGNSQTFVKDKHMITPRGYFTA